MRQSWATAAGQAAQKRFWKIVLFIQGRSPVSAHSGQVDGTGQVGAGPSLRTPGPRRPGRAAGVPPAVPAYGGTAAPPTAGESFMRRSARPARGRSRALPRSGDAGRIVPGQRGGAEPRERPAGRRAGPGGRARRRPGQPSLTGTVGHFNFPPSGTERRSSARRAGDAPVPRPPRERLPPGGAGRSGPDARKAAGIGSPRPPAGADPPTGLSAFPSDPARDHTDRCHRLTRPRAVPRRAAPCRAAPCRAPACGRVSRSRGDP